MTNIKNKLLSVALCFLMLVSVFGLGISFNQTTPVSVNAQTISVETEEDFWLVPGARIRYAGDGVTGISYRFQVKDSIYQSNKTDYVAVKYGVLIAPKDGYDLSYANVFGDSAIYDWAVKNDAGEYVYSGDGSKTRIVNLEASVLKADVAMVNGVKTNVRYFNGNMINIKEANLLREFQAKAYFAYSTDGINFTYVDKIVGDESNVRSIAYVAQMALLDQSADAPTEEQAKLLQDTYMTETVLNTKTSYTTEHYAYQNGGYKVIYTDVTENATLGATVEAATKVIDGYTFDASNPNNVLSGVVLANGKLVLKRYYNGAACVITINGGEMANDPDFSSTDCGVKELPIGSTLELTGTSCYGYQVIGWQKSNGEIIVGSYIVEGSETLTAIWARDPFSDKWGEWTPIS